MIEESIALADKVQWCTVQLGKLSSLHALVKHLKDDFECTNWVVGVLQPSGQTVRWVLGWSWMPFRAPDDIGRHKSLVSTGLQMEPNEMTIVPAISYEPGEVIVSTLEALPL